MSGLIMMVAETAIEEALGSMAQSVLIVNEAYKAEPITTAQ